MNTEHSNSQLDIRDPEYIASFTIVWNKSNLADSTEYTIETNINKF